MITPLLLLVVITSSQVVQSQSTTGVETCSDADPTCILETVLYNQQQLFQQLQQLFQQHQIVKKRLGKYPLRDISYFDSVFRSHAELQSRRTQ